MLEEHQGYLERATGLITACDTEYERQKVAARRAGRKEPATMPQELLVEKLAAEARHDVYSLEIFNQGAYLRV